MQLLLAAILLRREQATELTALAGPTHTSGGYPWGWDPPGPKEMFIVQIKEAPRPTRWRAQAPLVLALQEYLRHLQWPLTQPALTVTYAELALDYEASMGADLSPVPSRTDSTEVPIADRARGFAMLFGFCAIPRLRLWSQPG